MSMKLPRFGTDGWRALIAEDFTFDNVRYIAAAMVAHAKDFARLCATASSKEGAVDLKMTTSDVLNPTIAVGYDTRFLSPQFARALSEQAAKCGAKVLLSRAPCPTPALSFSVKHLGLPGGIMITASHNPPTYNGVKFKSYYGGSAMVEETRAIEAHLHRIAEMDEIPTSAGGSVTEVDFLPEYYANLEKFVDVDILRRFKGRVIFNPMFGAGCNTVDAFLRKLGVDVLTLNGKPDPMFGGKSGPEPVAMNMSEHIEAMKSDAGAVLGLATDGDADRFGVLDEDGEFVQLHDLMPLLFRYLVRTRGYSGDVVRTTSMADTIDKVAGKLGRTVYEVPVGFKNVCEVMLKKDILIGGEESGGFGYKNHVPERDGVLSCLLAAEMMASTGKSMKEAVAELRAEFGPFAYDRIGKHASDMDKLRANFAGLRANPPSEVVGIKVARVNLIDGVKFYLEDGSWMLMRLSDTEPLGRVYVGSGTREQVATVLGAGEALLFKDCQ
ncbi:MAG: phosphoglucomutase/phosphomannomutase family protein [Candidatus Sumerlaeales bacterium]|nr:phosphoglucomutase/phosphomannomutase family protein [Candidatus Sumerlaeales bacterium]